jgi:hypothetical protein
LPPGVPASLPPHLATISTPHVGAGPIAARAPWGGWAGGAGPPAIPGAGPPAQPAARYELGREIARGGMGRVVEATDTRLARVVALKEVLKVDDDVLARFAREMRITARLEHPSIVPLHDAGTLPGGAPYYVMRKISGRPLEQLVAEADAVPQRLVLVPHLVAAAQAIAHAHARGIVHRDIKPSNILVGELGETIVIDWGLAKVIGEPEDPPAAAAVATALPIDEGDPIQTRAGIVFGTPGFMAPEQLRGAPITPGGDVYALGATLYHVLARKPPHYSRSADEMMRAAVRGPATPIREVVPGVPPELGTIVDKALAHDPATRYQDARQLAEDLQRFLSGQLVASHQYSPRERLVRFLRKHRLPVGIAATAVVAIAIIGAIAVTRVIGERDRADAAAEIARDERRVAEEARGLAERRAELLTLGHARAEVTRDPARAVAMLKPLAARHWREVRSIAAAARARGIARSLPAPREVTSLELAPDGTRALAAGADGTLRLYDLATRTARELPRAVGAPATARLVDEGRAVLAWRDTQIAVLDSATGAQLARFTAPAAIRGLEIAGTAAVWVDEARAVWLLELAGGAPTPVEVPEPVREVVPSPDGRYLAVLGISRVFIYDREIPVDPLTELFEGTAFGVDWSSDSSDVAMLHDSERKLEAIHVSVGNVPDGDQPPRGPHIVQRTATDEGRAATIVGGSAYVLESKQVVRVGRDRRVLKQLAGEAVMIGEARGGVIVAGSEGGITVLGATGDHVLPSPAGALERVGVSPRSPFIVAASEGLLLVWNLDEIQPRRVVDRAPRLVQFAGRDHVLAAVEDGGIVRLELATGARAMIADVSARALAVSPSGQRACAIDDEGRAHLIVAGAAPRALPGAYRVAAFATEDALVLGDLATGAIAQVDGRTGALAPLTAAPAPLRELGASRGGPGWVAAVLADGTLWRRSVATGAAETRPAPPPAPGSPRARLEGGSRLQVALDGTVLVATGAVVRAWRPGGALESLVTLARPVVALELATAAAGAGHLLVMDEDRAMSLLDLARPSAVTQIEGPGLMRRTPDASGAPVRLALAPASGTVVVASRGGVDVIDPIARHRWTLTDAPLSETATRGTARAYRDPQISADGTRVIARLDGALYAWPIAVPASPAETARWVDGLTNATLDAPADLSGAKLRWK